MLLLVLFATMKVWFSDDSLHFLMCRMAPGFPDQRTCLLHQKLQMLNCCVERKLQREKVARAGSMEVEDYESGRFSSCEV